MKTQNQIIWGRGLSVVQRQKCSISGPTPGLLNECGLNPLGLSLGWNVLHLKYWTLRSHGKVKHMITLSWNFINCDHLPSKWPPHHRSRSKLLKGEGSRKWARGSRGKHPPLFLLLHIFQILKDEEKIPEKYQTFWGKRWEKPKSGKQP